MIIYRWDINRQSYQQNQSKFLIEKPITPKNRSTKKEIFDTNRARGFIPYISEIVGCQSSEKMIKNDLMVRQTFTIKYSAFCLMITI